METLIKYEEAALALGVSFKTIERLVAQGQLEVVRVGRLRRLRQSDIAAIADGKSPNAGEAA